MERTNEDLDRQFDAYLKRSAKERNSQTAKYARQNAEDYRALQKQKELMAMFPYHHGVPSVRLHRTVGDELREDAKNEERKKFADMQNRFKFEERKEYKQKKAELEDLMAKHEVLKKDYLRCETLQEEGRLSAQNINRLIGRLEDLKLMYPTIEDDIRREEEETETAEEVPDDDYVKPKLSYAQLASQHIKNAAMMATAKAGQLKRKLGMGGVRCRSKSRSTRTRSRSRSTTRKSKPKPRRSVSRGKKIRRATRK